MATLPTLPLPTGVAWDSHRSPRFNTVTQRPVSGARPVSFSVQPYPSWEWELNWEMLRDQGLWPASTDIQPPGLNSSSLLKPDLFALQDFFLAMNGSNGRFIYDPASNVIALEDTYVVETIAGTLVNGYSGTTDGFQTIFQLYRTSKVTGALVPVEAIDALSVISSSVGPNPFGLYLDGTLVNPADYTLAQYPVQVTFGAAPGAGQALSWNGNYAYVAKFSDDSIDLSQFLQNLYELQSLKVEQVPLGF